ncbi:Demethylmenaquinone methyltransferase [bioreactor metagenome]|uniref:Demethylmenaquinone methyltransferase n=1 Tax=bioreactor metagenome TaxID=1076179 RepID=A0A644YLW5_9ZZZZ
MEKEQKVYAVFQAISDGYDMANERVSLGLHTGWKRAAARAVTTSIPAGGRVLDLCCGTGDMTALLLEMAPDLRIVGLDFSPNMLARAKERFAENERVALIRGNAMALPFEGKRFDAAVISFGLRNTADYGRVLREMTRVVRRGGTVCCLDSFRPESRLVQPFYDLYFSGLMPLIGGGLARRWEYRWLCESTRAFLSAEGLSGLMQSSGLERITGTSFLFGACSLRTGYRGGSGSDEDLE